MSVNTPLIRSLIATPFKNKLIKASLGLTSISTRPYTAGPYVFLKR